MSIKARERVEFPRARRVCYYVRMTPEAFWKAYVGDRSPREFLERRQGRSLRDFVDSYLSQVPHLYGIVQRGTWRETFAAVPQWRRDEVAVGLLSFLEAHREEWEGMETAPPPPVAEEALPSDPEAIRALLSRADNPVVRISTGKGDMLVELYEDKVPNTVANLITLAESGFY
ncbi:MAG TPA: peptidylprolyl isomerase, partial [Candidatus Hydrogenedentes bacterium]|nr:peptidylprolyl isomerase [Candidatus Hydrogenedentota bacterium]